MNNTQSSKNIFMKKYKTKIAQDMEVGMINFLSEINLAPAMIKVAENIVFYEKIQGKTLYEILELLNTSEITLKIAIDVFEQLVLWLTDFDKHVFNKYNHYIKLTDFHYKNFMIDDTNKIYGIDFEQYKKSDKIDNYISLLAWFKLYNFENTQKIDELYLHMFKLIAKLFIDVEINSKVEHEVLRVKQRRKIKKIMARSTAVVMCGGKSERMGGFAKANLMLGEYTFLQHILYSLSNFDNLVVSCANKAQINSEGQKILVDLAKNIGPIGGIYTALNSVETESIFVISCDFPFINDEIIIMLFDEYNDKRQTTIAKINDRVNPLLGIYSKKSIERINQNINDENYKLMSVFDDNTCFIEVANKLKTTLYNINTLQHYEEACRLVKNNDVLCIISCDKS